ncbi:MAG: hypothetical protein ACK4LB_06760 [Spirosomataceae bacterium]
MPWTFVRISHALVGSISILAAIWLQHNPFLYILGVGFLFQSIWNAGCSAGECQRPSGATFKYRRRHR